MDIYLENTTGIGEHSDIVETIEKELNHIGKYKEQLDVLKKIVNFIKLLLVRCLEIIQSAHKD